MTLTVNLPDDLPPAMLQGDIPRALLEGYALEGYRSRKLTAYHVRLLLGHESRHETEQFLREHDAVPALSTDEVLDDAKYARAARLTS